MAKGKYTIDTEAKKVFITQKAFESLTDDERGKIKNYIDFGFALNFIKKDQKKKDSKGKEYYLKALKGDKEGLAEFNKILTEQGKGGKGNGLAAWRAAEKYAKERLAKNK